MSKIVVAIALVFATHLSMADTLRVPLGQQGEASLPTPTTGLTKAKVRAEYGEPQQESGPVGDPAIYRWDYSDFVVYFEKDRVIHSVMKFEPKVAGEN
ncbi:hypothetical protein [Gilvimarinus sp. DA14]|uniref:hypothetical protein n=1 Tax=Gilvimarinus sp. DA14 TaxID=2956798 RepID=UPI0020B7F3AE|nr:hypothetical protein [Gilvimarinus sp. DA14]UTF60925.1 hypothetical protein NHM04_03760 [Gilvimarinus sp. DA14]